MRPQERNERDWLLLLIELHKFKIQIFQNLSTTTTKRCPSRTKGASPMVCRPIARARTPTPPLSRIETAVSTRARSVFVFHMRE